MENKSGSFNGKYMFVWCVLCIQVYRLTDLISGEVVTGDVSAYWMSYTFLQTDNSRVYILD